MNAVHEEQTINQFVFIHIQFVYELCVQSE